MKKTLIAILMICMVWPAVAIGGPWGESSGLESTTTDNVFGGDGAGLSHQSGGDDNTLIGDDAGTAQTTADHNTMIGSGAGEGVTTGGYHTVVGSQAMPDAVTTTYNTIVGYSADSGATGSNVVAIGAYAGAGSNASDNVYLGVNAGYVNSTGTGTTAIGHDACKTTTSNYNTCIGFETSGNAAGGGGGWGTYVGYRAGYVTTGSGNAFVGSSAGVKNTTGVYGVAFGLNALQNNVSGDNNVAIGTQALQDVATTDDNTAVGYLAGSNATGTRNIFIGANAGSQQVAGDDTLYIDSSNTTTPLIGGDFATDTAHINGNVRIDKPGTKADGFYKYESVEVQTTDATATTCDSLTLLDENTYHIEARVIGVKSDGTDRASYYVAGTIYRTGAGGATIQGATNAIHSVESNAAWDADLTVNSNDVRVTVTGVAATTIEWTCKISAMNMSN